MKSLRSMFMAVALSLAVASVSADDYVVTGSGSRLFDDASMQNPTKNFSDQEISLKPGMAFKVTSKPTGWTQVMYSPGIRAFILDTTLSDVNSLGNPAPGNYKITNNPSKSAAVANQSDLWTITVGSNKFNGKQFGKIIVFFDNGGNQKFTLVKMDGVNLLFDYDNEITKFF